MSADTRHKEFLAQIDTFGYLDIINCLRVSSEFLLADPDRQIQREGAILEKIARRLEELQG